MFCTLLRKGVLGMEAILGFFRNNAGQLEIVLRLVVACACGGLIGLERSKRQKEAGLRTHIILALGSALMMIVSKYGFTDIVLMYPDLKIQADVSRVASNIITGVSFLGAGVIFVRGGSIKGLTTAAGIWATAGIGLAVGAGLYWIGVFSTLLLILIQIILHRFVPASEMMETSNISFTVSDYQMLERVKEFIIEHKIIVLSIQTVKNPDETLRVTMTIKIAKNMSIEGLLSLVYENPSVQQFSINT